ncbi:gamma-mobile-trio protein GmtX [Herminiimonas contaminans]|jgi:hypothetical protein|uniref:Alpha/beta hydrolase n=1 Tax=Herminiimonas contaminans TaxID=1111140 RepID=A0ABS0EMX9_9BURK|nr:gamma-mobile-trio protein GmtX [Herminiimonas contaminans]MBF8176060.1 alpha/beta hydrolase [Herminiimonas contaminans]
MTAIDPTQLFDALCAESRPQKQHNLQIMQEVCAELHRLGSRDFSLSTVGMMSQERGGLSKRALYNSTSQDFKTLIRSWATFATIGTQRTSERKSRDSIPDDRNLLLNISDPAMRALVGYVIADRDRLRGEVKLLRSQASVVIDRRVLPGHINITAEGQVIQVMSSVDLSDTERQALDLAISREFLEQEGWTEGKNGEILNSRGRKIFDIGFANAIRKVLMS